MRKIPTIYLRNPENRKHVMGDRNPDCAWVFAGEGVATFKWDGSSVRIADGEMWRRRELKPGKPTPDGFWQEGEADPTTGKVVGWVRCVDSSEDQFHLEAFDPALPDGTYEIMGPKIQGNPHGFDSHVLVPHGDRQLDAPTDFGELAVWLHGFDELGFEGVVWHHSDGRMAKIKRRGFQAP